MSWGQPTSFATIFKDIEDEPTNPGGQIIHFTGTGVIGVQDVVIANGEAAGSGIAPSDVGSGWTVKAEFLGDERYMPAESNVATYNTTKHNTRLAVSAQDVPWGRPTMFTSFLTDTDNRAVGIAGKTIDFNGSGVIGVSNQITDNRGKAVGKGIAPMNVTNGLTVKADFAGDNMYVGTSGITFYDTLKHQTFLLLNISPDIQDPGKNYTIQGRLIDRITGDPLDLRRVTFTAPSQIVLPAAITHNGIYRLHNLVAPSNPGMYLIQFQFFGDKLYSFSESAFESLTVR